MGKGFKGRSEQGTMNSEECQIKLALDTWDMKDVRCEL
jgi:hypothetical protein